MDIEGLFHDYLCLKYKIGKKKVFINNFVQYKKKSIGHYELYFNKTENYFLGWEDGEIHDVEYNCLDGLEPKLNKEYKNIDIYDEEKLFYILYTIDSTTVINRIDKYNKINDFMKTYCFFQLSMIGKCDFLHDFQKEFIKKRFFYYYLYCHPVNNTILHSFSINKDLISFDEKSINIKEYCSLKYDFYSSNLDRFKDTIKINKNEINISKNISISLIDALVSFKKINFLITSKHKKIINYLNDLNSFKSDYLNNCNIVFELIELYIKRKNDRYGDFCFSVFLQNYVNYILVFDINEIEKLFFYFKNNEKYLRNIINKIRKEALFFKRIFSDNSDCLEIKEKVNSFLDTKYRF